GNNLTVNINNRINNNINYNNENGNTNNEHTDEYNLSISSEKVFCIFSKWLVVKGNFKHSFQTACLYSSKLISLLISLLVSLLIPLSPHFLSPKLLTQ
ncbi:MAG: hypothetical protein J6N93_07710, partial [Clostridia bacterium]|nr:hypothetical protein [Clostridia bacterium]